MSNDTSKISRTAIKKSLYNNRDIILETKKNQKNQKKREQLLALFRPS